MSRRAPLDWRDAPTSPFESAVPACNFDPLDQLAQSDARLTAQCQRLQRLTDRGTLALLGVAAPAILFPVLKGLLS